MAVKINFSSQIFDKTARRQSLANFISRQAKDFKDLTKRRMIESKPLGRLYSRRRGIGFTRAHRASARGQRPAIDTGVLLNSIRDRKTNEMTSEVFAGAAYAEYLQSERLNRPIMSDADAKEAQTKAVLDAHSLLEKLS